MPTTTIRLPEELKKRAAEAAERAGTTTHNFILQAIAEKADRDERYSDFDASAEQRYADIIANGQTIAWQDMRSYLEARAAGRSAPRPKARKLAR